jgi:hypothetical protein
VEQKQQHYQFTRLQASTAMTGPVEWEPTQYKPSEIHDLRGAKQGPKVGV